MHNLLNPDPEIVEVAAMRMAGLRMPMSYQANRTQELWRTFMPLRKSITRTVHPALYSIEVYDSTDFFSNFDPGRLFQKWAAMEVADFDQLPENFETLIIPSGTYAVFTYRGKGSEAATAFRYIYSSWLPRSGFRLDERPHFARMDDRYKNEDPESEEELYIPIRS